MRARRLAAILVVAAFVLPFVPRVVGLPNDPHHHVSPDGRGECVVLAYGLMLLSLIASLVGSPPVGKRPYWWKVAAIGLWWFVLLALASPLI